jgi:hypothetical protein
VPDHEIGNVKAFSVAGSAVTLLVGGFTSRVFSHVWVRMAALVSNTTVA